MGDEKIPRSGNDWEPPARKAKDSRFGQGQRWAPPAREEEPRWQQQQVPIAKDIFEDDWFSQRQRELFEAKANVQENEVDMPSDRSVEAETERQGSDRGSEQDPLLSRAHRKTEVGEGDRTDSTKAIAEAQSGAKVSSDADVESRRPYRVEIAADSQLALSPTEQRAIAQMRRLENHFEEGKRLLLQWRKNPSQTLRNNATWELERVANHPPDLPQQLPGREWRAALYHMVGLALKMLGELRHAGDREAYRENIRDNVLPLSRRATRLSPSHPVLWFEQARILYEIEEYQEALGAALKAYEVYNDEAETSRDRIADLITQIERGHARREFQIARIRGEGLKIEEEFYFYQREESDFPSNYPVVREELLARIQQLLNELEEIPPHLYGSLDVTLENLQTRVIAYSPEATARRGEAFGDLLKELASFGFDISPVGDAKGIIEAITGENLINDEPLAGWERVLGVIPLAGDFIEYGGKIVVKLGEDLYVLIKNANIPERLDEILDIILRHFPDGGRQVPVPAEGPGINGPGRPSRIEGGPGGGRDRTTGDGDSIWDDVPEEDLSEFDIIDSSYQPSDLARRIFDHVMTRPGILAEFPEFDSIEELAKHIDDILTNPSQTWVRQRDEVLAYVDDRTGSIIIDNPLAPTIFRNANPEDYLRSSRFTRTK